MQNNNVNTEYEMHMHGNNQEIPLLPPQATMETNNKTILIQALNNAIHELSYEEKYDIIANIQKTIDEETQAKVIFDLITKNKHRKEIIQEIIKNNQTENEDSEPTAKKTKQVIRRSRIVRSRDTTPSPKIQSTQPQTEPKAEKSKPNTQQIDDTDMEEANDTDNEGFVKPKQRKRKPPQNQNSQPSNENTRERKEKPVTPITITSENTYTALLENANKYKYSISHAKSTNGKIRIYPVTTDDHRRITKLLDIHEQEYYCRGLEEDKLIRVVLKGIPLFINEDQVKKSLIERNITPIDVTRMNRRTQNGERIKSNMIYVTAQITEENKEIYNITSLNNFQITVENKRTYNEVMQCHRCQRFGHSQVNCNMTPRCHRCAGIHFYNECKKSTQTPPKCCNCGGPHPANHRGCPKFPKPTLNQTENEYNNERPPQNNRKYYNTINPNTSYVAATMSQQSTENYPPLPSRNQHNETHSSQTQNTAQPNQTLIQIAQQLQMAVSALTSAVTNGHIQ